MKIVEYKELGDPKDVLQVLEVDSAVLQTGEIRVKMLASPINPSNLLEIAGQYGTIPDLPAVPGSEGIGEIVELGAGVDGLEVGQRVLLASGGTWREEITGPAAGFIPVPAGNDQQMSMIAVNPATAHLLLNSFKDLNEGDWLIQSAANSAVGQFVVQLAALKGIKTINIVRRADARDPLMELGADVILVDGDNLLEQIKTATNGAPITLGLDCVGGDTFSRMVESLTPGGTLVVYGVASGVVAPAINLTSIIFKEIQVKGFWLAKWYQTASAEEKQQLFGELIPLVLGGKLAAKVDATYSLADIKKAVAHASQGGRNGKILLTA
ncbi:zinc-dependent alcohol dehydrogenase family protein [Maritalea sp.]|uniref:zinc-dependent alcohol dehydrogenase family protein n=1 Tax=Maritalea sp. TaxID=2003361 RepID=UPI003EF5C0E9